MNQVVATGQLLANPKKGRAKNGNEYVYFRLRCPRSVTSKEFDEVDCYSYDEKRTAWISKYLVKGQQVLILGEFRGISKIYVLLKNVEFAGSSRYKQQQLHEEAEQTEHPYEPNASAEDNNKTQAVFSVASGRDNISIHEGDDADLPF